MSKDQSVNAASQATAANEQIRESQVPESGTQVASTVRGEIQTVADAEKKRGPLPKTKEAVKLPSYEEALDEIAAIEQGENQTAHELAQRYNSIDFKLIRLAGGSPNGDKLGWHCEASNECPFGKDMSATLARLINDKVDLEKMKEAALRNRAKKEKRREVKKEEQPSTESATESIDSGILKELIQAVKSARDFGKLEKLLNFCREPEQDYLVVTEEGKKYKIEPKVGLKGSHELAQAFNSKRHELNEAEKRERDRRRVAGLENHIYGKQYLGELRKMAESFLAGPEFGIIKFRTLPGTNGDWTVEEVEGREGSANVVKWVLTRKRELEREIETKTARAKLREITKENRR